MAGGALLHMICPGHIADAMPTVTWPAFRAIITYIYIYMKSMMPTATWPAEFVYIYYAMIAYLVRWWW